jgi:hypothetical protein
VIGAEPHIAQPFVYAVRNVEARSCRHVDPGRSDPKNPVFRGAVFGWEDEVGRPAAKTKTNNETRTKNETKTKNETRTKR